MIEPHVPESAAITMLAEAVAKFVPMDGDYPTAISGLTLYRRSESAGVMHCIREPGLALIVQGAKRVLLADEIYDYEAGQALLTSVDIPVVSRVIQAGPSEPYIGLMLRLDSRDVMQLATELKISEPKESTGPGWSIETLSTWLIDAFVRLVRLLDEPQYIPSLAPLIEKEIVIRLLMEEPSMKLRQLVMTGSQGRKIEKAIAWLKRNYSKDFIIEELAASVHMSPSTFRQHFRSTTGTSPLQFQKQLRLQEARWLMLNENFDAGQAAMQVGYESVSQFSREYSRIFGAPPLRDVTRLRQTVLQSEIKNVAIGDAPY
ncbi:AraC family transcriptional regulator [Burkholderia pseudomallei]|nr:AraC family transcriptional regulator [Burkholderia pseudomallei]